MIATESHSSSAFSSWCVLKTRVLPRSRISRNADLSSATLTGSRPANGSSISEHVGVVEDGRDELDLLLVALREPLGPAVGDVADPESPEPGQCVRARPAPRDVVERREEHELVEDAHPPVQAALLGHVAPGPARPVRRLAVEPGHGSRVGAEETEDDPHRRRLAGSVRAEETEDLAAPDRERDAVERLDLPEPLPQPVDAKTHGLVQLPPNKCSTHAPPSVETRRVDRMGRTSQRPGPTRPKWLLQSAAGRSGP